MNPTLPTAYMEAIGLYQLCVLRLHAPETGHETPVPAEYCAEITDSLRPARPIGILRIAAENGQCIRKHARRAAAEWAKANAEDRCRRRDWFEAYVFSDMHLQFQKASA